MATYIKANNLTNLDVSGSWTTAGVPILGDLAQFTNTFNTAGTLTTTGNLSVGKLQVTNTARNIPLSPSGTLTLGADYSSDLGVAIDVASTYAYVLTLTSNIIIPTSATIKTGNLNLNLSGTGSKTFSVTGDLTVATAGGASPTMRFTSWDQINISGSLIVNSGVTIRLEGSDVDRITVNGTAEIYNIVNLDILAGSGTIKTNVGSGGTLTFNSFGTFSGSLVSGPGFGTPFYVGKDNSSSSFAGTISGSGALVKYGTGTLTLSGNNTYYGKTYVGEMSPGAGGGTLDVRSNTALGSGSIEVDQTFTLANGGSGSVSLANAIELHDNLTVGATGGGSLTLSGTITFDGVSGILATGGFVNITGALSGSTPRFKGGDGVAVLSCSNSTGEFNLQGGTVRLSGTTAIGPGGVELVSLSSGSFGNANSALLTLYYYYITFSGSLDLFGAGPLSFGSGPVTIISDPTLTPYEYDYTIPGVVSRPVGVGRLTIGAVAGGPQGILELSNTSNTFSGGVKVRGTLKIAGNGSLGATPGSYDNDNVWLDGGTLVCGANITFGANRGFYVDSAGGMISGTSGFTLGGVINGSGQITVYNSGTNNLNGTNTHTGGTVFLLGDTHLANTDTVGSGDIYIAGGTVYCDSSSTTKLSSNGMIRFTGGAIQL